MESKEVQMIPDFEAENLPSMCEIRFDCFVKMYEMGARTIATGFIVKEEKQLKPQWFKIQNKITLESIRNCDEYTLGRRLKEMLQQLDSHIDKYEGGKHE